MATGDPDLSRQKMQSALPWTVSFGIDQDFLDSIAGGVEELNGPEWESDLEENGGSGGAIAKRLEADDELGSKLGIRFGQGMVVSGPGGTRTLQEGPSLAEVEAAIAAVE